MAERTYQWVAAVRARHGDAFGVLARDGHRSPTVTSVTLPGSLPASTLLRAVKERGFTIGSGYGQNKETTVRIGHMGDHTLVGLERCLAACDAALDALLG
jgi:aspartate aminotransferase-like enzyme